MSAPSFMHRCLRNKQTGEVASVGGEVSGMDVTRLRLKFGDGTLSRRMTVAEIEVEWEWLPGIMAIPDPVVALAGNVVPFMTRGLPRNIPIQSGPTGGGAA